MNKVQSNDRLKTNSEAKKTVQLNMKCILVTNKKSLFKLSFLNIKVCH